MIEANELRIGNYILDDNGLVSRVNGFKPYDHSTRCDEAEGCIILIDIFNHGEWSKGWETESINVNPIPLTEEILLKCGDIKWLLNDLEGYYILINNKKIRMKFVHSLQNIYLYIEQKELNLCL